MERTAHVHPINKQTFLKLKGWKGVLFGVYRHSKGIFHVTSRVVTSSGCFIDNQGSKDCGLRSLELERNIKRNNGIQAHCFDNAIRVQCCEPKMTSVPIVVCANSA